MKERPILFSTPMVRAILSGQKTVTRREVKKKAALDCLTAGFEPAFLALPGNSDLCPYGQPGDRLWVRETFIDLQGTGIEYRPDLDDPIQRYAYAADYRPGSHSDEVRKDYGLKHKPSIHMPRAACRILLEITNVRVERLNDISEEQAQAEGIGDHEPNCNKPTDMDGMADCDCGSTSYIDSFQRLWESINGAESWDANPWVWCVSYKRT